ncbi:redoxin [Bacteriovorax sp. BSW11_IV]|nr:redoxin [Bacteriovorax sp. BSW11_IV]
MNDFKGKHVVLEWYNDGCPFVRKHYDSKNMQMTQELARSSDMIWLTISSSAPGKQGYIANFEAAKSQLSSEDSKAHHLLLDTKGDIGRAYNAKTTPEIFIIDPSGKIIYMGAIDSVASADKGDLKRASNYVKEAIASIKEGKNPAVAKSRPYGCSVKY